MGLWVVTPRDEGFFAHGQAMPRCMCTYPPGSAEREEWYKGWDKAKRILDSQG